MVETPSESDTVAGGVAKVGVEPTLTEVHPNVENGSSHEDRAAFLSTFSPEEEKAIMRKVDYRLLALFGVIYMVKQVCHLDYITVMVIMSLI
jgi:hypothetical protein